MGRVPAGHGAKELRGGAGRGRIFLKSTGLGGARGEKVYGAGPAGEEKTMPRASLVDVQLVNATDNQWMTVAQGTSIGNKKIDIWQVGPQLISAVRLNITKSVDTPVIKAFTVHLCN